VSCDATGLRSQSEDRLSGINACVYEAGSNLLSIADAENRVTSYSSIAVLVLAAHIVLLAQAAAGDRKVRGEVAHLSFEGTVCDSLPLQCQIRRDSEPLSRGGRLLKVRSFNTIVLGASFTTIVQFPRLLGVSAYAYLRDRLRHSFDRPSRAAIINSSCQVIAQ